MEQTIRERSEEALRKNRLDQASRSERNRIEAHQELINEFTKKMAEAELITKDAVLTEAFYSEDDIAFVPIGGNLYYSSGSAHYSDCARIGILQPCPNCAEPVEIGSFSIGRYGSESPLVAIGAALETGIPTAPFHSEGHCKEFKTEKDWYAAKEERASIQPHEPSLIEKLEDIIRSIVIDEIENQQE